MVKLLYYFAIRANIAAAAAVTAAIIFLLIAVACW